MNQYAFAVVYKEDKYCVWQVIGLHISYKETEIALKIQISDLCLLDSTGIQSAAVCRACFFGVKILNPDCLVMSKLTGEQIAAISDQCISSSELRLPARMSESVPTDEEKRAYLTGLLTHDPGVFLERHGKLLHDQQRQFFEPLRGDYEVNFYMMMLEDAGKTRQSQQADDMESSQEVSIPLVSYLLC